MSRILHYKFTHDLSLHQTPVCVLHLHPVSVYWMCSGLMVMLNLYMQSEMYFFLLYDKCLV